MNLVEDEGALARLAETLSGAERLMVDTEFESGLTGIRLCLVQLATEDGEVTLIDTLRVRSLEPLAPVFDSALLILHAAAQDLPLLRETARLKQRPRVFDTQIAWGLVSPEVNVSLAYLEYRLLGHRARKAHQADDWTRRPLPPSQLDYAAGDVAHLPALHKELLARLQTFGRDEALVVEATAEQLGGGGDPRSPLSVDDFRNAWQLDQDSQAGLRFLVDWLNAQTASVRSEAPEPKILLAIASRRPERISDLTRLKGIKVRWAERHGQELIDGMQAAAAAAAGEAFVPLEPPPYVSWPDVRRDGWLAAMRAEVCFAAQVAPELLLPGRALERLAGVELTNAEAVRTALGGFRGRVLAEPIAEYARRTPPPPGAEG